MRRARIKAVATVPVRRKAAQESSTAESAGQGDPKDDIKPLDVKEEKTVVEKPVEVTSEKPEVKRPNIKDEIKVESTQKNVQISTAEEITKHAIPEKPPLSPAKETEYLNDKMSENADKSESKVGTQLTQKNVNPQKTPTVESSPVKAIQNRSCFMRPTPRLDGGGRIRRNSIQGSGASASESEDDSKRSNSAAPSRVRNDSICSVQSLKDTPAGNIAKLNLGQKRKIVVSESARKLAEARREFQLKHENKSPDKSKLTMYDLIYYNPITNPMKPKPVSRQNVRKDSICSIPEKKKEEEVVDEPAEILVPQVKVGPNGQLIIDEQSLVIDQYKAQENIDRSDILVDEDTNGNGFYKRRQKSKEWSKWETMKFYKALSTYGTDFLLMQSVFPKRTRQELKLKYKKEERLNHPLVEKALRYQEFDTEALEKDLANVEEIERKETERVKPKKDKDKAKTTSKKKRRRCQLVADTVTLDNDDNETAASDGNSSNEESSDENVRITITRKIRKRKRKAVTRAKGKKKSNENNSDSESEMRKTKSTRSGRTIRKTRKATAKAKAKTKTKTTDVKVFDEDKNKNESIAPQDGLQNDNDAINKEIERYDSQFNENLCNGTDLENMEIIIPIDEEEDIQDIQQDIQNLEENIIEESENAFINTQENHSGQLHKIEKSNAPLNAVNNIMDDDIPNISNLKPGSLVVLKKDSAEEPGKTTVQVYIVSSDFDASNPNYKESLLPIELSPDVLETVTNCIKDIEPEQVFQEA